MLFNTINILKKNKEEQNKKNKAREASFAYKYDGAINKCEIIFGNFHTSQNW